MSSTVARKTGSATLVIPNFSQKSSWEHVTFSMNGSQNNYFGIQHKNEFYSGDTVVIYFISISIKFKYKATVSIINSQRDKLFSREYLGEFKNGIVDNSNYFNFISRYLLLYPKNGYLYNDKLTLLCEVEVIEMAQENRTISDSIQKDLSHLTQDFKSLLNSGKFTDVTLVIGSKGKEFPVHKAILAARSPVFAAMFEHDCEEKRLNRVEIIDMDENVCAEMLSFVYSGKVQSLDRYAMELLEVADKYQLNFLKSICEQYMCSTLSVESVVNVLLLADLHQVTSLKAKCIEYISANVDRVQTTDGWKVLDTNVKLLKELFIYSSKKK